ncbi:hypothetical protein SGCOL_002041 [Colletotrichum sp. CLE4]
MQEFAFDGVDIDWQWPAAGNESKNNALLIQEMRLYFNSRSATSSAWGISFTAPVEEETLARLELATMANSAGWINLIAYDADSQDQSVTRAMSDHKSIEAAVDALGSAGVPATKINLGIGFFDRSYKLGSTSCSGVGCAAADAGISYGEDNKQWISYEDRGQDAQIGRRTLVGPVVTLGIVFSDDSVSDASIDFGVNGRVTFVNEDVEVFAQLNASTLFVKDINTGTGGSGPFPVVEPVWNKGMRVSNWFGLVFWEFDNYKGSPSLRALYAQFIEDYLLGIEGPAALKNGSKAKTAYETKLKSVNTLRKRWCGAIPTTRTG